MMQDILRDLEVLYQHKPHRMAHVLGVRDTALTLGNMHNCDLEKLELAALLHDITKYDSYEQHVQSIRSYYPNAEAIIADFNPNILHAFSAVVVAHNKYHITDPDILDAIEHHTVGAPHMSIYEAIIFISDYIEPNRTYDSCKKVRDIAFKSLNKAIYTAIDDSIVYYETNDGQVPTIAYQARDYYKQRNEESN